MLSFASIVHCVEVIKSLVAMICLAWSAASLLSRVQEMKAAGTVAGAAAIKKLPTSEIGEDPSVDSHAGERIGDAVNSPQRIRLQFGVSSAGTPCVCDIS